MNHGDPDHKIHAAFFTAAVFLPAPFRLFCTIREWSADSGADAGDILPACRESRT